ncbi:hypothetical protein RB213_013053, partial [Colletotrichum asianum]
LPHPSLPPRRRWRRPRTLVAKSRRRDANGRWDDEAVRILAVPRQHSTFFRHQRPPSRRSHAAKRLDDECQPRNSFGWKSQIETADKFQFTNSRYPGGGKYGESPFTIGKGSRLDEAQAAEQQTA